MLDMVNSQISPPVTEDSDEIKFIKIKAKQKEFRSLMKEIESVLVSFMGFQGNKIIDLKKELAKFAIVEDGLVKVPKNVVDKVTCKRRGLKSQKRNNIKTISDLAKLEVGDWRSLKVKKFLDLYQWCYNEENRLSDKQMAYISQHFREYRDKGKYVWEIATKQTWLDAYQKIKSCMSGKKSPLFYLRHPEKFVCLVCYLNDEPVARCVFLRYKANPRYVIPVRVYCSDELLVKQIVNDADIVFADVNNHKKMLYKYLDSLVYLDKELEKYDLAIPSILKKAEAYKNETFNSNELMRLTYVNLFSYIKDEFKGLVACVNEIACEHRQVPYFDFRRAHTRDGDVFAGMISANIKNKLDAFNFYNLQKIMWNYPSLKDSIRTILTSGQQINGQAQLQN